MNGASALAIPLSTNQTVYKNEVELLDENLCQCLPNVVLSVRSAFTFLSGIVTFLVAWAILGQDSSDRFSSQTSMDLTVMYKCYMLE